MQSKTNTFRNFPVMSKSKKVLLVAEAGLCYIVICCRLVSGETWWLPDLTLTYLALPYLNCMKEACTWLPLKGHVVSQ